MKNTPLSAAAANDDLLYVILLDPTANTLHPGLWRSFANKRLQSSFPSSYRKKKMTISELSVLRNPEEIQELPTSSSYDQKDDTHSLLMTAVVKEKHSWETFTHQEISLATNNFETGDMRGQIIVLSFHIFRFHQLTTGTHTS
jgi:hypothetical protein